MTRIMPNECLDIEDVETNIDKMCSYAEMREVLLSTMKSAKGNKKLYLRQILDVLDLSCQLTRGHDSEVESEIYSILS